MLSGISNPTTHPNPPVELWPKLVQYQILLCKPFFSPINQSFDQINFRGEEKTKRMFLGNISIVILIPLSLMFTSTRVNIFLWRWMFSPVIMAENSRKSELTRSLPEWPSPLTHSSFLSDYLAKLCENWADGSAKWPQPHLSFFLLFTATSSISEHHKHCKSHFLLWVRAEGEKKGGSLNLSLQRLIGTHSFTWVSPNLRRGSACQHSNYIYAGTFVQT